MRDVKRIVGLGVLAVGLGIGAAVASTGTASADDFQISIDGMDLFPTAGNTATAVSSTNDIAIAYGDGSYADAGSTLPGQFDTAFADGIDSEARAIDGNFDGAFADGTDNLAAAGDDNGDFAFTDGNDSGALAQFGNGDFASVVGDNSNAYAGGLFGLPGNDDFASVFDPTGSLGSFAGAGATGEAIVTDVGSFDLASAFGDGLSSTTATGSNFLTDLLSTL
jgi:hypothetical protein